MPTLFMKKKIYTISLLRIAEAIRTNKLDYQVIDKRKDEYRLYEKLTPSCYTSDG